MQNTTRNNPSKTIAVKIAYKHDHYSGDVVVAVMFKPSVPFGRINFLEGGPEADCFFLNDDVLIAFDSKAALALNFKTQKCFHFVSSDRSDSITILRDGHSVIVGENSTSTPSISYTVEQIESQWRIGLGPCAHGRLPTATPLPPKSDPQYNN